MSKVESNHEMRLTNPKILQIEPKQDLLSYEYFEVLLPCSKWLCSCQTDLVTIDKRKDWT